jgi:hypothetical protein
MTKHTYRVKQGERDVWIETKSGIKIEICTDIDFADKSNGAYIHVKHADNKVRIFSHVERSGPSGGLLIRIKCK